MTPTQFDHLDAYVRGIADLLRLRDTTIVLLRDHTTGDMNGQSQTAYGRNGLSLFINAGLVLDRPQLRQTVVHELLHHHFHPLRDLFIRFYGHDPDEDDDLVGALYRCFLERMETCLDTLADVIAESMPLINPFPDGD